MSEEPLVSVIVPFHNRTGLLNALIDSLPDTKEVEIILVDDHSGEEFKLQRKPYFTKVRTVKLDPDKRYAGSARNKGIEEAFGEFLFFADSDDIVDSRKFMQAVHEIPEDIDILYTRTSSFLKNGDTGTRHLRYNRIIDQFLAKGDAKHLVRFHPPWAKFIRRSFIEAHALYFDQTRVSNDVMFNARLHHANPRRRVSDAVCYHIREGEPSLTTEATIEDLKQRIEVGAQYNAFLREIGLWEMRSPALPYLFQMAKIGLMTAIRTAMLLRESGSPVFWSPASAKRVRDRVFRD